MAVAGGALPPLRSLPRGRQHLLRNAQDLALLVPFVCVAMVPGASLLLPLLVKACPFLLPSTFPMALAKRRQVYTYIYIWIPAVNSLSRSRLLSVPEVYPSCSELILQCITFRWPAIATESCSRSLTRTATALSTTPR